jgi:hypothetical protein
MKQITRPSRLLSLILAAGLCASALAAPVKPPKNPAKIAIAVAPEAVAAGGQAEVTLSIAPIEGVKVNRYPQIKLKVAAVEGLVAEAEVKIGDTKPPPAGKKSNYWEKVDPVKLTLAVDEAATSGDHEIDAKLTYFFCLPASGFCAPARVPVKIPVSVE